MENNNNTVAFNSYGAFSNDGNEYYIYKPETPVPWCNILANENFGTVISSYGTVYSYFKNSSEFKMTSWCNDFAKFVPGETFKGIYEGDYNLVYGFGYTRVLEQQENIKKEMDIFVPVNDDVKVQLISLSNMSDKDTVTDIEYEISPVLGVTSETTSKYILSRIQNEKIELKNSYSEYFSNNVVYLKALNYSGDDSDIIQYNIENYSVKLSLKLRKGETKNIAILLGASVVEENDIDAIINKYSNLDILLEEYSKTKEFWKGKVKRNLNTGDKYIDIMANGWLLYQTIASRLFARTGFYQAGGAFGYRDQLQDSMALIRTWPEFTRKQIIKHSGKQFSRGDVLHWWHEHNKAGIKTYFSDDYLWLPYVVAEYVIITNDISILKEKVPFLIDRDMEQRREIYDVFESSSEDIGTVYEHCIRAIKYGLSRKGKHGLLDIGDGDWNDGFSTIKGESVWLTFFMIDILKKFAGISEYNLDEVNKMHFDSERHMLKHAIFASAFDGEYFARAFYPDGEPLGSSKSEDCKIDLISQCWAAISLKDYPDCEEDIKSALYNAEKYLVDRDNMIVKLLYPPFDNPKHDPGYIKAYVPGVRENGGQYTHAAVWLAKAYFDTNRNKDAMGILRLLNPIYHSENKETADVYMVEPYVVAADVYANKDHLGRGGWTWYTGSSAWMYKVIEDNFGQNNNNK